jgi:DNA-binding NtrC family response regulator
LPLRDCRTLFGEIEKMLETKKTILVVDDDQSILRVFTRVLERKGFFVTTVENGTDAINQVLRKHFDAALIDVRLPDMEGTAILPRIQETSPKTVKIVFTGSPDLESLGDGQRKDMDAFFTKPVQPEFLLAFLDEKLRTK